MISSHLKLENYGKKENEQDDLTLMVLKNKMRLNMREIKILDKAFKIRVKNKFEYHLKFKNQGFLSILLENFKRFLKKRESKIRDTLSKKEDYDFLINVLKHLSVLVAENAFWEQQSKVKLGNSPLSEYEEKNMKKSYDNLMSFFFKENPLDYQKYDIKKEINPILEEPIFTKTNLTISYPINLRLCETIETSLIETEDDNKVDFILLDILTLE